MKLINLSIALMMLLLACTAWGADQSTKEGEFWKATCSCQCKGVELNTAAVYKTGFLEADAPASAKAIELCHEQCARSCGGYTELSSVDNAECAQQCTSYCSAEYSDSINEKQDKCALSCSSTCGYRGIVDSIVQVIYYVAGILGALMLVINGLRLVTSQDPRDRNAAKNGIIFVVIALIIIILAATLVDVLMNSATTPQA